LLDQPDDLQLLGGGYGTVRNFVRGWAG
jgi:hypothetical protein